MATRGLDSRIFFWGGEGKIEGRHKGRSLRYYAAGGGHFYRCVHRISWTRAWRQGSCKL